MDIEEYIEKIVDNGKIEDMETLSGLLEDTMEIIKDYDKECYKDFEMKLYEMAYGKKLTDDMKKEWVKKMRPMSKWTEEEVQEIYSRYGASTKTDDLDQIGAYGLGAKSPLAYGNEFTVYNSFHVIIFTICSKE